MSEHEKTRPIGQWGREHLRYIQEWRPIFYADLALSGDLGHYLADLNEQAQERLDRIMAQMRTAEGVTEELKHRDQLGWVGAMNSIRSRAEDHPVRDHSRVRRRLLRVFRGSPQI